MPKLNRIFLLCCCMLAFYLPYAQKPDPAYKLLTGSSFVQSKNYYLLTLLQENREAGKLVENDPALSSIAANKLAYLAASFKECTTAACFTERMKFSDKEIQEIGSRLSALYTASNALGRLVGQHLIPSGAYVLFSNETPQQQLVRAWEQDAAGINFTIGVYAEGRKANYPAADSTSFHVQAPQYTGFMYSNAYLLKNEYDNNRLFFSLPLAAALRFLELNEREQAADYEPMRATVNKPAFDRVRTIKWDSFRYSVILVPGMGPDEPFEAISAESMLRCRLAALQYAKGMAPFIMVSGGKVHPFKTPYCEAYEMKKFLTDKLHIPENAVIVEPHARHTTTNMRNCARIIFRYGIPFTKACLAVTTRAQSSAITTSLPDRCLKELHEIPYKNGNRLTETETEFYPLVEALHINPTEPIDP